MAKTRKGGKRRRRRGLHIPGKPWAEETASVLEALLVSPDTGLGAAEVRKRRRRYGFNRLKEKGEKSSWVILAGQFKNLIIVLLLAASAIAFAFGEVIEGIAIAAVILINALIGFLTEWRAIRSMEALQQMSRVAATVRRSGKLIRIAADSLVPGDIVVLEAGDIITADCRIIDASKLQVDESALTGESVPVGKRTEALQEDVPLAERGNMLYKGTALTRGSGEGVVVSTGMETELGRISSLVEEAEEEVTPLEKRLNRLGRKLIWVTLGIVGAVVASGILAGKPAFLMIETGIALAIAAIPEGLPIVATIALARGMWRMARRNALINRLSAVETLGTTNVICTDKTGTLTENKMTLVRIAMADSEIELDDEGGFKREGAAVDPGKLGTLRRALEIGALCNNSALAKGGGKDAAVGDPMETALLEGALRAGISRDELLERLPEEGEEAFDSDVKMMATFHAENGGHRVAVKGAPEAVLESCARIAGEGGEEALDDAGRKKWLAESEQMAEDGLRVLAVAEKAASSAEDDPYGDLLFVGLLGLLDPPRKDVRKAIDLCQDAGIRVVMVTGDHAVTARSIALAVGLVEDGEAAETAPGSAIKSPDDLPEEERKRLARIPIFSRVSPRQKLDLVHIHQTEGDVVAMTGDGVNDAPALKKADIGVAMGKRGTEVAREASDMILKDDAFSTIVAAVRQGRVIFNNIRKFVFYLISCNVSEIMVVGIASLVNAPLPILPLQILFLNFVTDVFPALALGVGEGDPRVMEEQPRHSGEAILTRRNWLSIGGYGLAITAAVLGSLAAAVLWLGFEVGRAVTVSFLTLAFAQLWHVFNMRDRGSGFLRNDITRNPFVWGALALCVGLIVGAVYIPGLSAVLKVSDPGAAGWLLVLAASLVPWVIGQIAAEACGRGGDEQKACAKTPKMKERDS